MSDLPGTTKRFLRALREQYDVMTDGAVVERVQQIVRRLERYTPLPGPCHAAVVYQDQHNAFVVPGYVFITSKLLKRCHDDAILAMILAHELAHLALGHVKARSRLVEGAVQIVSGFRETRRHEDELAADRRGLEMCIAAGYDPERCIDLGTLLQHVELDHGRHSHVFGSGVGTTHPGMKRRQKALRAYLAALTAVGATTPRCAHCDQRAGHACAHCDEPLCAEHGVVGQTRCPKCEQAPYPLCRVCKRTRYCLVCNSSLWCRYCKSAATHACPTCERAFCATHASYLDPDCRGCQDDAMNDLRAQRKQRIARMAGVGAGALAVLALLILRRPR